MDTYVYSRSFSKYIFNNKILEWQNFSECSRDSMDTSWIIVVSFAEYKSNSLHVTAVFKHLYFRTSWWIIYLRDVQLRSIRQPIFVSCQLRTGILSIGHLSDSSHSLWYKSISPYTCNCISGIALLAWNMQDEMLLKLH